MVQENQGPIDNDTTPVLDDESTDAYEVPQTDVHLSKEFVQTLQTALKEEDTDQIKSMFEELHAADVADILATLSSSQRRKLIELEGTNFDPEVFSEVEGEAQDDLYEHMPNDKIADALTELDTDDAVYVIEELDDQDREEVLRKLASDDRVAIEESLSFPVDSAGRLMQRDLVSIPQFWTVGQTIDYLRNEDNYIPEDFYDIFIVDPFHRVAGTIALSRLMSSKRVTPVKDIMDEEPYLIDALDDEKEVAYQFTKYHLISAGVVDDAKRLVGVITVDDVVDVIEENVQADILALAGVREESGLNESFIEIMKGRFTWLFVNLGTAILASVVIGLFEATLEQMVALAILMPIVASMGGNAGTQTMTVAVRAIATKELNASNVFRVMNREMSVAFMNGVLLALFSGAVAAFWFNSVILGGIFASAMVINMLAAGLSGLLIPITLNKLNIDPAIASSVFVTTITDVVGFFAFLGLAAVFIF